MEIGESFMKRRQANVSAQVKRQNDVARFFSSFKENGFGHTMKLTVESLFYRYGRPLFFRYEFYRDRKFDARLNIDTCGNAHLNQLTIDSENTEFGDDEVIYQPIPVVALGAMASMLPADVSDFIFIDFGSGKGRALLFASLFNFKKIIGIEFAEELHVMAQQNIGACRNAKRKCFNIESVLTDAVSFPIPDDRRVFFLFNPFEEYVLTRVANNIKESYLTNPREMYVIYYNPVFSTTFDALNIFQEIRSRHVPLLSESYNVKVYKSDSQAFG